MTRGRPRKPIELHLIKNTYRRDRHGPLPEQEPQPEPVEELDEAAAAVLAAWRGYLEFGIDFFSELPPGVSEAQARRQARKVWHIVGRAFMATRQHDPVRSVPWAVQKFGEP